MRVLAASSIGIASGIFVFTAAFALVPWPFAAAIAAIATIAIAWWQTRRPIVLLDDASAPPSLRWISAAGGVVALVLVARLAVFHVAPQAKEFSQFPGSAWELRHSCVSAYFVAGRAADSTANVYDNALYSMPDDDPTKVRKP